MEDRGCWVRKVHSAGKLALKGARADQVYGEQTRRTGKVWTKQLTGPLMGLKQGSGIHR